MRLAIVVFQQPAEPVRDTESGLHPGSFGWVQARAGYCPSPDRLSDDSGRRILKACRGRLTKRISREEFSFTERTHRFRIGIDSRPAGKTTRFTPATSTAA